MCAYYNSNGTSGLYKYGPRALIVVIKTLSGRISLSYGLLSANSSGKEAVRATTTALGGRANDVQRVCRIRILGGDQKFTLSLWHLLLATDTLD